jgi:hypothetical protein
MFMTMSLGMTWISEIERSFEEGAFAWPSASATEDADRLFGRSAAATWA